LLQRLAASRKQDAYAAEFPSRLARPAIVKRLPTLAAGGERALTPMLAARFAFAGAWTNASVGETWLAPAGMLKVARSRAFRDYHAAHREHWEGSAPARFPDERLSVFAVDDANPDHVIYLAWPRQQGREPALYYYSSQHETVFRSLAPFLRSRL
jgi:hypothetical protein